MMALLELKDVSIAYGDAVAVHGVTMNVDQGSVVALLGPNGAGKSSLVKAVAGLVDIRSGDIRFDGKPLPKNPAEIVKLGIAVVPEGRRIFPEFTVEENLLVGGHTQSRQARREELARLNDNFQFLRDRRNQLGGLLSGGEQQLLAICRGLMTRPSLVVIDEPSLGLSPIMIKEIATVIRHMKEGGMSVLLVEQNSQFALRLADYAYILERGNVADQNSAEKLREGDYIRKSYLGL